MAEQPDFARRAAWLAPRLATDVERVTEDGRPKSGFSAETVLVTAHTAAGPQRLVVRRETPDPAVYPAQTTATDVEVDIQYRALAAVERAADIPVAPLIGYEADPSVLGSPFFVMRYVAGQVPIENPPYTREGFFHDASPAERGRMIAGGLDVLARVHRTDWRGAGLDWLVPDQGAADAARQLRIWEAYADRELDGRDHPVLERARTWLHATPPRGGAPVLCWGDARPGNIIWDDFRPACVTDWEAVAIAPPETDLGWWLFFDRTMHEAIDAPRLPGEPTPPEQRDHYASAAKHDPGDVTPFEVFAGFRYAAIVVRTMNRLVARGVMPPDQTVWLNNPPATALAQLLDEIGA
ncbi:MAG: phosphotransferase family protein [Streptomycetaceae bacterium]|nr:phosphotransferase family protein [Streptomycetaceae bacterium]